MKTLISLTICSCLILFSCSYESSLNDPFDEIEKQNLNMDIALKQNSNMAKSMRNAMKVFRSAETIVIDGHENEWSEVPKHKMREEIDLGYELDSKFDLSSYFKMLWDDDNLYVFARILDDEINVNGNFIWEMDGLEMYIDGNNSKTAAGPYTGYPAAYGTNTDFFRFIPGEPNALSAWGIIEASNIESQLVTTADGYNVEISMPFDAFPDFAAEAGHLFGVEFQVNDNDNDVREQLIKWWSDSDDSFFDPSTFGTAVLFKATAE